MGFNSAFKGLSDVTDSRKKITSRGTQEVT